MNWYAFGNTFLFCFSGLAVLVAMMWGLARLTEFLDRFPIWVSIGAVVTVVALVFATMAGVTG